MEVITSHTNTDFDAFASMLACRHLYPGAVIALPGSLNRNVRDFYRVHADELRVVEASSLEAEEVTRLIVVEATDLSRLGELEELARRPGVELVLFDHHPEEPTPEHSVVSDDGALTTMLVGILAERKITVTPLEATVFALGIHEDTGSLTDPSTTQHDVDALGWCLRHGARQEAVAEHLNAPPEPFHGPLAGQIMSRPARFVGPEDTVAHAMAVCQRHRQSGVQVGEPEKLLGVVTREDLDKAIGHDLAHAPVKAVMSSPVTTCEETTPLGALQHLLTSTDAGRIPVLRRGEVVGVVSRGDVLRALGDEPDGSGSPDEASLREQLLALEELVPLFETVQALSDAYDGVYLVGGTVRDILLGEDGLDVDIAVEGDGVALGTALASALRGRVVPHERFGTAVVVWPGGRVDVATTRTELYDEPGALPTVEAAALKQDLYRRDFTINAMAVSLRGDDFGRLIDFFRGRGDLERGVVRVLHNLSFIDDPTRIFRAVRYETRYGFRMDAHSVSLARACVEMGLVGELSSERLRGELELLLSEDQAANAVLRLGELGLAGAIHGHLATDEETAELLACVDDLRERYASGEPAWRARLAVLARRLSPDELYEWFERLRLRRSDADEIADAVTVAPRLAEQLGAVEEPADVRRMLAPHDPLGVILALALGPAGVAADRLVLYLDELRAVRLEVSGDDLAELGLAESPRVGIVLDELLRRKLNGDLGDRTAELEAARELIRGEALA